MFDELDYLTDRTNEIFMTEYVELEGEDAEHLDEDEMQAETESLVEKYCEAVECIGYSYGSFIMELRD